MSYAVQLTDGQIITALDFNMDLLDQTQTSLKEGSGVCGLPGFDGAISTFGGLHGEALRGAGRGIGAVAGLRSMNDAGPGCQKRRRAARGRADLGRGGREAVRPAGTGRGQQRELRQGELPACDGAKTAVWTRAAHAARGAGLGSRYCSV